MARARHDRAGTPALVAARRAGIAVEVLAYEHAGGAAYGREAAEALGLDPSAVHKTLVVRADDRLVVGIVPVDAELDLKALARAVGARRAAMAATDEAERATGYVVGGISPLGQKRALPTVVDAAAMALPTVYVSGGRRGLELGLAPADLVRLTAAVVAPVARR